MAYKALYRQFRPRRFSEIKDQPSVSQIIKNQVKNGRPSHAYIFSGPRGTGKTSTAKILACALNCLSPEDGEPCLKCENCLAALNDTMPDIIEMDAASNTGVDDARALREKINLMPVNGKYKVYIIDEVHMLSNSAFNALLKTIEEPPDYAVFILATTELRKLPKTVLSRCQRFDFKAIESEGIKERLSEVVAEIGRTADGDALDMIAEAADGGMRDALTILEKICSTEEHVTSAGVASVLNFAESGKVRELAGRIAAYDEKGAVELLIGITDSGIEPQTLVNQLILFLRDVLIASVTGEGKYAADAADWTKAGLIKAIDALADAEKRMSVSSRPNILLESAVLRLLLPERQEEPEDMSLRIDKLEKKLNELKKSGAAARTETAKPAEKAEERAEEKTPKTAAQIAENAESEENEKNPQISGDAQEIWSKICTEIKKKDIALYARIRGIDAAALENGKLKLTSDSPSKLNLFGSGPAKSAVEAFARDNLGIKITVETQETKREPSGIPDDVEIID